MNNLGIFGWIALILVLIGGVDAGMYGIFQFHVLEILLSTKYVGRVFYLLIGISAGFLIYKLSNKKKIQ